MNRGQTTVELILILAASMLALSIIFSLYTNQVNSSQIAREQTTAKVTVDRIVNTANVLYASGAGSKSRILIELPDSLRMNASAINGREVNLALSNGGDVISSADVIILGDWKKENGRYIFGSYFANMYFDGNVVKLLYDDFELSAESVSLSAKQSSTAGSFFTIRNLSSFGARFWISQTFEGGSEASFQMCEGCSEFVLNTGESKLIDFNISLSSSAYGNYVGVFDINAQLSNGVSDSNYSKRIVFSIEAFPDASALAIYPKSTSFAASAGSSAVKSFSICNSSENLVSGIVWEKVSRSDANMLDWYNLPALDLGGNPIDSINSGACKSFNLTFNIPPGAPSMVYDSNFFAVYNDSNRAAGFVEVAVS